jgi:hypothetical protein
VMNVGAVESHWPASDKQLAVCRAGAATAGAGGTFVSGSVIQFSVCFLQLPTDTGTGVQSLVKCSQSFHRMVSSSRKD